MKLTSRLSRRLFGTLLAISFVAAASAAEQTWVTYEPKAGPGKGKHIVLIAGDEEYRSEEGLPLLGKILSQRHGFKCTVLFSLNADGTINPDKGDSLAGSEALDSADAIVMSLRFRHWKDDAMQRFEKAYLAGKPMIGLRTSTHAFAGYPATSQWARYNFNSGVWKQGFGRQVLGETWVNHHGGHKSEATRGIIEEAAKEDPILRGVTDIFGDTDVYTANPMADSKILVRGAVLAGMKPTDEPVTNKKTCPCSPSSGPASTRTRPARRTKFSAPPWARPPTCRTKDSGAWWSTRSIGASTWKFRPRPMSPTWMISNPLCAASAATVAA